VEQSQIQRSKKENPPGVNPVGCFVAQDAIWNLRNDLVRGAEVLNDPFFPGGLSMGNPKIAIVAYCLAVGFILVVALHSPSKTLITASAPPCCSARWCCFPAHSFQPGMMRLTPHRPDEARPSPWAIATVAGSGTAA
jgi:hypothetical protein